MKTTAIYPNRWADKHFVEHVLRIPEVPLDPEFPLWGWEQNIFKNPNGGELINLLRGYHRVVYGDHGPYVEFSLFHLMAPLTYGNSTKLFEEAKCEKDVDFYYYWLETIPRTSKIYYQLKDVSNMPNAPERPDGLPSQFNRPEGYADYKVGMYYISAFDLKGPKL